MDKKLTRNTQDKMVAGVASGLAQYFQLDVVWVRIAFALAACFGGGGLWVYIILWIAMPEEANQAYTYTDYRVNPEESPFNSAFKQKDKSKFRLFAGLLLVGFGSYFLMDEFDIIPHWFHISKLWPLVLVAIGLSIIYKGSKKAPETNPFDPTNDQKKTEDQKVDDNDLSDKTNINL